MSPVIVPVSGLALMSRSVRSFRPDRARLEPAAPDRATGLARPARVHVVRAVRRYRRYGRYGRSVRPARALALPALPAARSPRECIASARPKRGARRPPLAYLALLGAAPRPCAVATCALGGGGRRGRVGGQFGPGLPRGPADIQCHGRNRAGPARVAIEPGRLGLGRISLAAHPAPATRGRARGASSCRSRGASGRRWRT